MKRLSSQHQVVLVIFLRFTNSPHSCTEGMYHSLMHPPNVQVCHCTWSVLPGFHHISTASNTGVKMPGCEASQVHVYFSNVLWHCYVILHICSCFDNYISISLFQILGLDEHSGLNTCGHFVEVWSDWVKLLCVPEETQRWKHACMWLYWLGHSLLLLK